MALVVLDKFAALSCVRYHGLLLRDGIRITQEKILMPSAKMTRKEIADLKEIVLAELRGGPEGIAKFNSRDPSFYQGPGTVSFAKEDLRGLDLSGVQFAEDAPLMRTKFHEANLTGAKLASAWAEGLYCTDANLSNADMRDGRFGGGSFKNACFRNANLESASFNGCNLRGADFTGACLRYTCLRAANLTGAILDDVDLLEATFGIETKFPVGFEIPGNMQFEGPGDDPRQS